MEKDEKIFRWCLGVIPFFALIVILYKLEIFIPTKILPPCLFHVLTGYSCPGCGCTRAVEALLQGNVMESLRQNPIILYCVILYIAYVGSHFVAHGVHILVKIKRAPKGGTLNKKLINFHGMKSRPIYLFISIYLLLGFFVIRLIYEIIEN